MRRLINIIVFILNIICSMLLLASYTAVYLNPEYFWPIALIGLGYPILLILNVVFVLYWAFQGKLRFLYPLAAVLAGIMHTGEILQFHEIAKDKKQGMVSVATFNTQLQGYYQGKSFADTIGGFIRYKQFDIVCLQEFFSVEKRNGSTFERLKQKSGLPYIYFEVLDDNRKTGEYGSIILSRFPIIESGQVEFENTGNLCIYADMDINGRGVRIYNAHLQSFRFKKDDYKFVEDMPEDKDQAVKQSRGLVRRMRDAYIKRAGQVQAMREHLDNCTRDIIICGDFNDPPLSYTYGQLSKGLKDAFTESGSGIGNTYIGKMPSFRIDYILYSPVYKAYNYHDYILTSDHKLVESTLELKNQ